MNSPIQWFFSTVGPQRRDHAQPTEIGNAQPQSTGPMARPSLAAALLRAIRTIRGISRRTHLSHKACRRHTQVTIIPIPRTNRRTRHAGAGYPPFPTDGTTHGPTFLRTIVYSVPLLHVSPRRWHEHGGHSSVGRASDCGSEGRAFEPRWPPQEPLPMRRGFSIGAIHRRPQRLPPTPDRPDGPHGPRPSSRSARR